LLLNTLSFSSSRSLTQPSYRPRSGLRPRLSAPSSSRPFDLRTATYYHLQHRKHLHLSVVWFLKNCRVLFAALHQQRSGIIWVLFVCVNPFVLFFPIALKFAPPRAS